MRACHPKAGPLPPERIKSGWAGEERGSEGTASALEPKWQRAPASSMVNVNINDHESPSSLLLRFSPRRTLVGVPARRHAAASAPPGDPGWPIMPGRSALDPRLSQTALRVPPKRMCPCVSDSASLQRDHMGVMWSFDSSWTWMGWWSSAKCGHELHFNLILCDRFERGI